MKPVLHLRSVRANLARVVRAQLKLATKIDALNEQFKDLLELRTILERQLPSEEQPQIEFAQSSASNESDIHGNTPSANMPIQQVLGTPSTSKVGWPKGLSRTKTPCLWSPIPHRHRTEGDNVTCVGITYPEKATVP